jgi:SAM-dependent methyltransferase
MDEAKRVREVYAAYDRSKRVGRRRRPTNPGNQEILAERDGALREIVGRLPALLPLRKRMCLDVGCGRGDVLAELVSMGARPQHLVGVDLLDDRIEAARSRLPGVTFLCGDVRTLKRIERGFDLVTAFTVFSSIADRVVANEVARSIADRTSSGATIILYDVRYPNPFNRHLRPVSRRRIDELFPGFHVDSRPITLLPPLARQLRCLAPRLYRTLSGLKLLRTHRISVLTRP